ncbi:MAG: hypothetical protein QXM66_06130 [Nitrososphaerota archaeon]
MNPEPMPLTLWLILSTRIIAAYLLTLLFTKNISPRYRQTSLQHTTQNMREEVEEQEINKIQKLEEKEEAGKEGREVDLLESRSSSTSTEKIMVEDAKKMGEDILKEILRELEETRREDREPEIIIQLTDTENGENKFKEINPIEDLENLKKELFTLRRILKRQDNGIHK